MSGEVDWAGGCIVAQGQLNRANVLRQLCAGLHQTITDRGYKQVTLDFRKCDGVTEAVFLPILPLVARYREQDGVAFQLQLPESNNLYRLFINTNWAHFIQPDRFDSVSEYDRHIPAQRFKTSERAYELVVDVIRFIMRNRELSRDSLSAVEWSLQEITDNVISHAKTEIGGFVQATLYQSRIEFVVADAGIGIPSSLGIENHQMALQKAIKEDKTRDCASNAGNGLFGSYQAASISKGQFEIHSGRAYLYYNKHLDRPEVREGPVPFSGTSVRCAIGQDDNQLLDRALKFSGQKLRPVDYVELTFETDGGEIVFAVQEHAQRDLGSRGGGASLRRQLENLLRYRERIVLDFKGVTVISSSFADEVFGRLFVELGPRAFMSRVLMRNVAPTVDGLIDRAIVQRTKLGNLPHL